MNKQFDKVCNRVVDLKEKTNSLLFGDVKSKIYKD